VSSYGGAAYKKKRNERSDWSPALAGVKGKSNNGFFPSELSGDDRLFKSGQEK